jgi:hypothetical protein
MSSQIRRSRVIVPERQAFFQVRCAATNQGLLGITHEAPPFYCVSRVRGHPGAGRVRGGVRSIRLGPDAASTFGTNPLIRPPTSATFSPGRRLGLLLPCPLRRGEGGPRPAFLRAGAGRVRGRFREIAQHSCQENLDFAVLPCRIRRVLPYFVAF